MALLDDSKIEISCPKCGHKQHKQVRTLKTNPTLTCPACGAQISIEAKQLRKAVENVDRSVAKLRDSLRKLGKR